MQRKHYKSELDSDDFRTRWKIYLFRQKWHSVWAFCRIDSETIYKQPPFLLFLPLRSLLLCEANNFLYLSKIGKKEKWFCKIIYENLWKRKISDGDKGKVSSNMTYWQIDTELWSLLFFQMENPQNWDKFMQKCNLSSYIEKFQLYANFSSSSKSSFTFWR